MMKAASVYEIFDEWYFEPSSRATTGLWVATPPLVRVGRHDPGRLKYEAAFNALNASRDGVPLPEPEDDLDDPLLAIAGVKSQSAFVRRTRSISLELEDGRLRILPYRKLGSRGALESIS